MTSSDSKLIALALWCLEETRDEGSIDIDGGSFQDKAQELGILVTVTVAEPCGENCFCAEYYGEFPAECLRVAPDIREAMRVAREEDKNG